MVWVLKIWLSSEVRYAKQNGSAVPSEIMPLGSILGMLLADSIFKTNLPVIFSSSVGFLASKTSPGAKEISKEICPLSYLS